VNFFEEKVHPRSFPPMYNPDYAPSDARDTS